jgi:hypothetical protein
MRKHHSFHRPASPKLWTKVEASIRTSNFLFSIISQSTNIFLLRTLCIWRVRTYQALISLLSDIQQLKTSAKWLIYDTYFDQALTTHDFGSCQQGQRTLQLCLYTLHTFLRHFIFCTFNRNYPTIVSAIRCLGPASPYRTDSSIYFSAFAIEFLSTPPTYESRSGEHYTCGISLRVSIPRLSQLTTESEVRESTISNKTQLPHNVNNPATTDCCSRQSSSRTPRWSP